MKSFQTHNKKLLVCQHSQLDQDTRQMLYLSVSSQPAEMKQRANNKVENAALNELPVWSPTPSLHVQSSGAIDEPWQRRPMKALCLPTPKSCLKAKSSSGRSHLRVRFDTVVAKADACGHGSAQWTRADNPSVSLMRDETTLRTESSAWSYTWAYDAVYLQFAADGKVDPKLQRTLLRGINMGYLTLERFSGDSRARLDRAQQARRSILEEFQKLLHNGEENSSQHLGEYCRKISRGHKQWAAYMGRLQHAASKMDLVARSVPHSRRGEIADAEPSKTRCWKIKLSLFNVGTMLLA
jgi:hypothetical protein